MNDYLARFLETKNQIAVASPAPQGALLLKRDSSVGENLFEGLPTPINRGITGPYQVVGYCKDHAIEKGFAHFVSDDDSDMDDLPRKINVRDFIVSQLVDENASDVESEPKKVLSQYEEEAISEKFSFEHLRGEDPFQELFQIEPKIEKKSKSTKSKPSKKSQKILQNEDRVLKKPVNCVKRQKLREGLEKKVVKENLQKEESKDTNEPKVKRRDQKSNHKSTKNRSELRASSESGKIHKQDKIEKFEGTHKINEMSSDEMVIGRKSLRLLKKENNLDECKGCTCKKSQ
jgi:hypothetical protein